MKNFETAYQTNQTKHPAKWLQKEIILNEAQCHALLASLPHSIFLDSGVDESKGRFNIISGSPLFTHTINKAELSHTPNLVKPSNIHESLNYEQQEIPSIFSDLPFTAGLIGYSSYEYGALNIIEAPQLMEESKLPLLYIGEYTWSYIHDKKQKRGYLTYSPRCPLDLRDKIENIISDTHEKNATYKHKQQTNKPNWQKTISYQRYSEAFEQIQSYIIAGDCYQVNLTQRFEADFDDPSLPLYFQLREKVDTPYSAFISFSDDQQLLSFSPEQFIGIKNKEINTKPIKGTAQNTNKAEAPQKLQESTKNQAENLMIVDLLRNDLSKVCELGSVKVEKLFELETFKNVHHLISHIKGRLRKDVTELDAFFACFPGGSITGAPKIRSMEIINELEGSGRDAYCGSIFYLNGNGNFDSNILIRTIVHSGNKLHCWGGGGIVHDSNCKEEYLESLTKVSNLTGISE
ncbi:MULTISPECIES: anthranilate synthase component I family protein [unclassified Oleiphilus]|uniref:anthranilate synthase component I family protein n=4 Tax=Oleiphilus TaxID=141450 RepID=UPI0007C3FACC|nr:MULTISPECIES: anthranilate synthase component I family protein [unclassified Oleiphilus]KZZ36153.1 hypothetical protein A3756_13710 [Oleiphilus sp. HI0086]KZZ38445.1 hypothetical protein A3757_07960 [Oleiphilus sp. HI0117]